MLTVNGTMEAGEIRAMATTGRGLNAEEITGMLMNKLINVADTAPPAIREQAVAFKTDIRQLVLHYVRQAQKSQNTSIYNVLMQAGQSDAAELVRKL